MRATTRRLQRRRTPPPPCPTIVIKTVDEDSLSVTGEDFSLASEDNFASKDMRIMTRGTRRGPPPARQRAIGRAAAAQVEDDAGPNKEAMAARRAHVVSAASDDNRA